MGIKAILFDIDGTLIVTGGAGAESWTDAFKEIYDIPADIGEYTDNGMTDPEVGRLTFKAVMHRDPSDEEFAHLLARRTHFLKQTVHESTGYRVLPGVTDLLPELQRKGYLLGLITGNGEESAELKLGRAEIGHYFTFGGYGSDSEDRAEIAKLALQRSGVDADEALVVGDTPLDVEAAHAAGMKCVGVGSHKYSVEDLRAAHADWAIASLAEGLPL